MARTITTQPADSDAADSVTLPDSDAADSVTLPDSDATDQADSDSDATDQADSDATDQADSDATPKVNPIDAVIQAVGAAVHHEGTDPTTGAVPAEAMGPVTIAFAALTRKADRDKINDDLLNRMTQAVMAGNTAEATALAVIAKRLRELAAAVRPGVTLDPIAAYVDRYATLTIARDLLPIPDGVDWTDEGEGCVAVRVADRVMALTQSPGADPTTGEHTPSPVATFRAHMATEGATVPDGTDPLLVAAWRIANGQRVTGTQRASNTGAGSTQRTTTYTGPNRSVAKHIVSALADSATGEVTLGDIRKHRSDEYGADAPSAGAINAHLFDGPTPKAARTEGNVRYVGDYNSDGKRIARLA